MERKGFSLRDELKVISLGDFSRRVFSFRNSGKKEKEKIGAVLVLGGGIAGVQASLDLADSGFRVYLVEKNPSIGGVMAQLDKTFPTNDCSMCILSPKLVDVGRHPNIELITKADLERVEGKAGNFKVTIRKDPRYVDLEKCTACGDCMDVCPVEVDDEYQEGLTKRKAIYQFFAQSIPNAFAVEKRGIPRCRNTCPLGMNVQGYTALIANGKFKEALRVIRETNPLPSICGRVCHHPCESECKRNEIDEPIAIASLKRFVADNYDLDSDREEIEKTGKKVAIIGSGPAGLTTAYDLAKIGHTAVIFESMPVAGGMLALGIPEYRLPRGVLEKEINGIKALGVRIQLNTEIGKDLSLDDLRKEFDAVFIAVGAHVSSSLNIPGEDIKGVVHGVDFLRSENLKGKIEVGKKVAVIGGGNVAIDAARTAIRKGAQEVTLVYRRSRKEMPAHEEEIEEALEEGVKLKELTNPVGILGGEGRVVGIKCIRMKLGEPDESGRRRPIPIPDSEFVLKADQIIIAIGQSPGLSFVKGEFELTGRGILKADPDTLEVSKGVFAGGDAVTGPATVVEAMASGRKAAISIDRYLGGKSLEKVEFKKTGEIAEFEPMDIKKEKRREQPLLPVKKRVNNFEEVRQNFDEKTAIEEAKRCLNCGICSECQECVEKCEANAIDHEMREEFIQFNVGSIILSLGFDEFDPKLKGEYGYGRYKNVVSSIEFERMLSATGPSGGIPRRASDGEIPKKIAFIQCVGSRDEKTNPYCSSVCCMYSTKQAVIAKEHLDVDCSIFFMDMRTHGKEFEQYYNRARDEYRVDFIRCRAPSIEEIPNSGDLRITYEEDGKLRDEIFDLVVLSVGLKPPKGVEKLSEILGIELNKYGFCNTSNFKPTETSREGIFVCGAFQGPKDIPESVTQASGAASRAGALLSSERGTLIREKEYPPERDVSWEKPRIGVFVCRCGINIAGVVNVPEVVEYTKTFPNVVYVEENLFTCSQDTQEKIKEAIEKYKLNRVVVASCSPRTHESLFRNTIREAGLNPYLFEMVNIRDQCSWVHHHEPEEATEKAKELIRMIVAKSRLLEPLKRERIPVKDSALIIGGGVAGMTAALDLANQGYNVDLIERDGELGGHMRDIYTVIGNPEKLDAQEYLQHLINEVNKNRRIIVHKNSEISDIEGHVGNFKARLIDNKKREREIESGIIIVSTGALEYRPSEFLYGKDKRVVTQSELEKLIKNRMDFRDIVMIQCVNSRDQEHEYCSRICCTVAIKNALRIKEQNPDANIYILYRDMRTYGFREDFYREAREKGILFIRYEENEKPGVELKGNSLMVSVTDPLLKEKVILKPDLLVLSSAIVPQKDNKELSKMLKIPLNRDGFFLEAHMKLRPVDFSTDGIFVCGLAHSPKFIDETISQASAAASRASTILSKDFVEAEGNIAFIDPEICVKCLKCIDVCPYSAIEYNEEKDRVEVIEVMCKGCGLCSATCLSDAVQQRHFTNEQICAQINALMER